MNKRNLLRAATYLENVPNSKFSMKEYRSDWRSEIDVHCNCVGDIIGHCTWMSKEEDIPRGSRNTCFPYNLGNIEFGRWSELFFGLYRDSLEWKWVFSGHWYKVDNTVEGAINRIRQIVENGLTRSMIEQMEINKFFK